MPYNLLSFDGFINESYHCQSLILEGGSYGHMSHPFDDKNLTFGDFKTIVDRALDGKLDIESNVVEKLLLSNLSGYNNICFFSYNSIKDKNIDKTFFDNVEGVKK